MSARTFVQEIVDSGYVYVMEHAGFKAALMKARRLEDNGQVHGLPAGAAIPVFPIACLPGAPDEWVREAGTYVCPVDTEWGLWFDWTMNNKLNTAILPSCKGMNPLTGQKLEGMVLETFADKCPVHNKPFAHGRHCEECGYVWPPQNWVSDPNILWWDGFRQPDGSVRQFFFTDEDKRDIATAVIGKKNTVPAFGFAFYQPKQRREPPRPVMRTRSGFGVHGAFKGGCFGSPVADNVKYAFPPMTKSLNWSDDGGDDDLTLEGALFESSGGEAAAFEEEVKTSGGIKFPEGVKGMTGPHGPTGHKGAAGPAGVGRARVMCAAVPAAASADITRGVNRLKSSKPVTGEKKSKSVSVGAGAKISQELVACSLGLDGWKDQPEAVIRLYFCFEDQFRAIVKKGGIHELKSSPEGYLKDCPVG